MLFCKQRLSVKTSTHNDFIYGELGRTNYYTRRLFSIIKYWFKVISTKDRKYVKQIYYIMLDDIASNPNVKNWASMVKTHYLILGLSCLGISRRWQCKTFSYYFQTKLGRKAPRNWASMVKTHYLILGFIMFGHLKALAM